MHQVHEHEPCHRAISAKSGREDRYNARIRGKYVAIRAAAQGSRSRRSEIMENLQRGGGLYPPSPPHIAVVHAIRLIFQSMAWALQSTNAGLLNSPRWQGSEDGIRFDPDEGAMARTRW